MCNPPFFVSDFEASHGAARSDKRPQPSGACTGTDTETVTGGGEVEFVKSIIKDSLAMKEQIRYGVCFTQLFISLSVVLFNPVIMPTVSLALISLLNEVRRERLSSVMLL